MGVVLTEEFENKTFHFVDYEAEREDETLVYTLTPMRLTVCGLETNKEEFGEIFYVCSGDLPSFHYCKKCSEDNDRLYTID